MVTRIEHRLLARRKLTPVEKNAVGVVNWLLRDGNGRIEITPAERSVFGVVFRLLEAGDVQVHSDQIKPS